MTIPTMIIGPPTKMLVANKIGKRWQRNVYPCDNGYWYTLNQLAGVLETVFVDAPNRQALARRITLHGWNSELILLPMHRYEDKSAYGEDEFKRRQSGVSGTPHKQSRQAGSNTRPALNKWESMGSNVRVENFKKIRPLGEFERQELVRKK